MKFTGVQFDISCVELMQMFSLAFSRFLSRDAVLINSENQVQERTFMHRLAFELHKVFDFAESYANGRRSPILSLDVEYNRDGDALKEGMGQDWMAPDIILHERRSGALRDADKNRNNIFVCELKKSGTTPSKDAERIIDLMNNRKYQYGINIKQLTQKPYLLDFYRRGCDRPCEFRFDERKQKFVGDSADVTWLNGDFCSDCSARENTKYGALSVKNIAMCTLVALMALSVEGSSHNLVADDSFDYSIYKNVGSEQLSETIDGVEYFYVIGNCGAILKNGGQCAVNIGDDRKTLILPEYLGGVRPLIAIDAYACNNLTEIETIKLSSELMYVGPKAFEGCSSLKSIVLPTRLMIGSEAFKDCENLVTIDLHEGISVSSSAFEGWTGLKEIVLPEKLEQDLPSFSGCTALKTIKLPKRMARRDGRGEMRMSFRDCESLESIVLPIGLDRISRGAFENCRKLRAVTLPDTIKEIKSSAFMGCSSLKKIDLPYKISRIESNTFTKCSSLESITIPENVEVIEYFAFSECTSLKEVVLPLSVKHIHPEAFVDCNNIKTFKVPASIKDQVLNAKTGHLYDSKRFKDVPEVNIVIVND